MENNNTIDLSKYKVARSQYFSHSFEPTITLEKNYLKLNSACMKRFPENDYVLILCSDDEKTLAVIPCREDEPDALRWCSTAKRVPREMKCPIVFAHIMLLMNWNPNYKYKLLGKLLTTETLQVLVFDLRFPEIYIKHLDENDQLITAKNPVYEAQLNERFGISFDEHKNKELLKTFAEDTEILIKDTIKTRKEQDET